MIEATPALHSFVKSAHHWTRVMATTYSVELVADTDMCESAAKTELGNRGIASTFDYSPREVKDCENTLISLCVLSGFLSGLFVYVHVWG